MESNEFRIDRKLQDDVCSDFLIRRRRYYGDYFAIKEIFDGYDVDFYQMPDELKTVVDLGAHIGLFSLKSARTGAEVYAFEPEGFNYEVLCHNVKVNGYQDKIHCARLGVGNPKETKLYIHPTSGGSNSFIFGLKLIPELEVDKFQNVRVISIHDVFSNIDSCDLLKIDIEGSEKYVIEDFDEGLAKKVKQISLEFHDKELKKTQISKLSVWYDAICTDREERIYVFRRKHGIK